MRLHHFTDSEPREIEVQLPISKSLLARRLMLTPPSELEHYSHCSGISFPEDIRVLYQALRALEQGEEHICVGESGTAMRFMLARIVATASRQTILSGLGRQHSRPIAPLVDALRTLGGDIEYLGEEGYPPLLIRPSQIRLRSVSLDASASSQYLSALLLLCPYLPDGQWSIDVSQSGLASAPYAQMTAELISQYGYSVLEDGEIFRISSRRNPIASPPLLLERDWTASSYAYQCLAMMPVGSSLMLPDLYLPSLQGDSEFVPKVYRAFGIRTEQVAGAIRISRIEQGLYNTDWGRLHCGKNPDIVPSLVASFLERDIRFRLEGVEHLRIKESDRIESLRVECLSLGFVLQADPDALVFAGERVAPEYRAVYPYGDHRIAMSIAPLAASRYGAVEVANPEVVGKSFPTYWTELERLGYNIEL